MGIQRKKETRFSSLLLFSLLLFIFLGGFSSRVTAQGETTPSATNISQTDSPSTPSPIATASPTTTNTVEAHQPIPRIKGDYVEDEILVRFAPQTGDAQASTQACFVNAQAQITAELGAIGAVVLKLNQISVSEAIALAENCPNILLAEPNYHLYAVDTFPNDSYWGNQYGLSAIHAPQGWDITTGSAAVVIAIIDTGVDLTHPDLAGKIVAGYDFVNNDAVPQDDNGHGTHVAGIAAAESNNGVGVAGVSWGAQIMPVKVLGASAGGSFSNAASGIIWATDRGAQIINLSLGSTAHSTVFQNAIDYAYNHGVTVIAASGNSGNNFVLYPARYPNVIAVGATDATNTLAGFSNYGPEIDIVAPGDHIYSTWLGNNYTYLDGTSMSAPYVAGLAAILRGIPGSGSPANLAWAMKSTALDLGIPGRDNFYGDGLIQMDAAIALLWVSPTSTPTQTSTPLPSSTPRPPRPTSGYTPPALLLTSTSTATVAPSLTFTPTQTVFAPPTEIPSYDAEDSADLIALGTPTKAEITEDENQKMPLLPCLGTLCILFGIFLFWLGMQMRKNNKKRIP